MALKAREVHQMMKDMGVDPRMGNLLTAMVEEQLQIKMHQVELAQQLDRVVDLMQNFGIVAENMKSTVEKLKGEDLNHEELGAGTHTL